MNYIIIGDIHGHADELELLLDKIGVNSDLDIFRHSKIIFVGDLIDRGSQNKRVIEIVRTLCDKGYAHCVMGNHEYNAICYHTQGDDGEYLREHCPKTTNNTVHF